MPNSLVSFQGEIVNIMGLRGIVRDGSWTIDIDLTGNGTYVMFEVDKPDPTICQKIESIIISDRQANREHLIDHVLISNRYAVCLYLENHLDKRVLENAEEVDGDLVCQIKLAGKKRNLLIRKESDCEYNAVTIDANGNVV